jgi:hypothetical protein
VVFSSGTMLSSLKELSSILQIGKHKLGPVRIWYANFGFHKRVLPIMRSGHQRKQQSRLDMLLSPFRVLTSIIDTFSNQMWTLLKSILKVAFPRQFDGSLEIIFVEECHERIGHSYCSERGQAKSSGLLITSALLPSPIYKISSCALDLDDCVYFKDLNYYPRSTCHFLIFDSACLFFLSFSSFCIVETLFHLTFISSFLSFRDFSSISVKLSFPFPSRR